MQAVNSPNWETSGGIQWPIVFLVVDLFVLISVAALAVTQATQIARNVTTNELANWQRYSYLRDPHGMFTNPFDRGCRNNCLEAMLPKSASTAPLVLPEQEALLRATV